MKRFILMITMLCCLLTATAIGVVGPGLIPTVVTQQDACKATANYLGDYDRNYSYYVVENNDSTYWNIFVDTRLGTGWERKCYLSLVERSTLGYVPNMSPNQVTECLVPPSETLTPLQFTVQWTPPGMDSKPRVAQGFPSEDELRAAARTYAIILNGGINKNANHERYWNDCSFVYQTLVKKLGVPKTNISVIMADGTDPSDDMTNYANAYSSSPLDLDFDGEPDIQYAATMANVKNVFSRLATKMTIDDHLLFFVVGAGGREAGTSNYYIRLWGEEKLSDLALDGMFGTLLSKGVTINAVFGQSFGGGLMAKLSAPGTVITSATDEEGYPSSFSDSPYSEFLYWWTSAINRANAYESAVESDFDGNGLVSMEEAATFAKNKVAQAQYESNPKYLGAELSFGGLAETTNLYIKDDYADVGAEPNTSSIFWDSPSIWVRNNDDNGKDHEFISYAENNGTAYVYVKIHNRGKDVVEGTGRFVDLYWAQASTAIADRTWAGAETYGGEPTGGYIGRAKIGAIASGDSAIVKVKWMLPHFLNIPNENFQYCVAACLEGKGLKEATLFEDPDYLVMPAENRGHAVKNVSVITPYNATNGEMAYVRNTSRMSKVYSLSLVPRASRDTAILTGLNIVELEMDAVLMEAWKRGGKKSSGVLEIASINGSPSKLRITDKDNSIDGIRLDGRALSAIKFKAKVSSMASKVTKCIFDLVQKDSDGKVVGAVAFELHKPGLISALTESELMVTDAMNENSNDHTAVGIKSATSSVAVDRLTVELLNPAPAGAEIAIASVLDGGIYASVLLIPSETMAEINVATLKPGLYAIVYLVDGVMVDTAKFTKR